MAEKDAVVTDASEDTDAEALEFVKGDAEEIEEDAGEGDSDEPRADAAAEDADVDEPAPEDDAEDREDQDTTEGRFKELTGQLRRYQKYDALIEMFEEQPELARKVAAKKLGLDAGVREVPAAPTALTPEQEAAIKEQWADAMQKDPVGTITHIIREVVRGETKGTKSIGVKALIREYKAERRNSPDDGELFKRYEHVFDAFAKEADQAQVESDPDTALIAIENIAYGTWAREQRARAAKAKGKKGKVAARETPRSLETPTGDRKAVPTKSRKPLTDEERDLVDRYGEDAAPDDQEPESVWGRS